MVNLADGGGCSLVGGMNSAANVLGERPWRAAVGGVRERARAEIPEGQEASLPRIPYERWLGDGFLEATHRIGAHQRERFTSGTGSAKSRGRAPSMIDNRSAAGAISSCR